VIRLPIICAGSSTTPVIAPFLGRVPARDATSSPSPDIGNTPRRRPDQKGFPVSRGSPVSGFRDFPAMAVFVSSYTEEAEASHSA
jgi:hypothetical protein